MRNMFRHGYLCFWFFGYLLSLTLNGQTITNETPAKKRLEILNIHVSPHFDELARFERSTVDAMKSPNDFEKVFGFIKISPPNGQCFVVTTKIDKPDNYICKPDVIKFYPDEINRFGKIFWKIKTNEKDFGTEVSWQTPYRLGRMVTLDMPWPGQGQPFLTQNCQADKSPMGRRITIDILGAKKPWKISFPDEDYLVDQPKPKVNLFFQVPGSGGNVFKAEAGKKMKQGGDSSDGEDNWDEGDVPIKRPNLSKSEARGILSEKKDKLGIFEQLKKDKDVAMQKKIRHVWQLHPRDTYTMNGSHFMSEFSSPTGSLGRCQYNYRGLNSDSDEGMIECHEVENLRWVLLPIPCLSQLRPNP